MMPRALPRFSSTAWTCAALLFSWLAIYPLVGGIVAANDDLKFLRSPRCAAPLSVRLTDAWHHDRSFRPLEILVASGCDAFTLACPPVVPVQIAGLIAVCVGVVALTKRMAPTVPILAPLVLIWVFLSPSTMSALWQMDAASQTWSAALGIWCAIVAWDVAIASRTDAPILGKLCWLFAICAVGMNIKETFYGWCAAIAVIGVVTYVIGRKNAPAMRGRAALALIPIIALPALYAVLRYTFGGLGVEGATGRDLGGRYGFSFDDTLISNCLMSAGGMFSTGPVHLFANDDAQLFLRVLPAVGILASGLVIGAAGLLGWLHRAEQSALRPLPVLLGALLCIGSIAATLPLSGVSELYGFGPNIGSGVLIAAAGWSLWNLPECSDRAIGRFIVWTCALTLCAIGLYGLAGRSYHFTKSWGYAHQVNEILLGHRASVPPSLPPNAPACVYFNDSCYAGSTYGQVIVRPLQSVDQETIIAWLTRTDPTRIIDIVLQPRHPMRPGIDLEVDCRTFPARILW